MLSPSDSDKMRKMFADLGAPSWAFGNVANGTLGGALTETERLRAMTPAQRAAEWNVPAADVERDAKPAKKYPSFTFMPEQIAHSKNPPAIDPFEAERRGYQAGYSHGTSAAQDCSPERLARDLLDLEGKRGARVVTLSAVEPERVRFLWDKRIPFGMLTLVDGDPGVGKSTITLDLTARITTGAPMPLCISRREPSDVILIGNEDHLGVTTRPRLDAAGADVSRVHAIVAVPVPGDPDAPLTLADVADVERIVIERKATVVFIDPLMAHLPSGVDAYRDSDMRSVLTPWAMMAARTGVAIVVVRHLRKGGGSALYRGGGSIGIIGAARSALLVARDPEDPDTCVLAHSKGNLAPPAESLRYRVIDRNGVGVIEWLGVADGVTADHLAATQENVSREVTPMDAAVEALRSALANGPRPTSDVEADVAAMTGAKPRTIERARSKLGVKAERFIGPDGRVGGWVLALPGGVVRGGVVDRVQTATQVRGGGVESSLSKPLESNNTHQTATDGRTDGGVEAGGVEIVGSDVQTAATGDMRRCGGGVEPIQGAMWSPDVYEGARRAASLHSDPEDE